MEDVDRTKFDGSSKSHLIDHYLFLSRFMYMKYVLDASKEKSALDASIQQSLISLVAA
jgi:hypothetical protein